MIFLREVKRTKIFLNANYIFYLFFYSQKKKLGTLQKMYTEFVTNYDNEQLQSLLQTNKEFILYEEEIQSQIPGFSYETFLQKPIGRFSVYAAQLRVREEEEVGKEKKGKEKDCGEERERKVREKFYRIFCRIFLEK